MLKYAIHQYFPQRYKHISFEQQEINRLLLSFKDGRRFATAWAVNEVAGLLRGNNLSDVTFVCIPSSSPYTYARRYKRFSRDLASRTNANDGYSLVSISGKRSRAHKERQALIEANYSLSPALSGRKVIVIDDIYTTGKTSQAFLNSLKQQGADIVLCLFLAKTKNYRYN